MCRLIAARKGNCPPYLALSPLDPSPAPSTPGIRPWREMPKPAQA